MKQPDKWIHTPPRKSATFDDHAISEIRRAAATGIYDIRGFGAKRKLPHFDDLLFLGASMSRYPLEGYREKCATDVTIGARAGDEQLEERSLELPAKIHVQPLRARQLHETADPEGRSRLREGKLEVVEHDATVVQRDAQRPLRRELVLGHFHIEFRERSVDAQSFE